MSTEIQVAKLALQHVGDRFDISSLTESTTEAEQVNLIFADVRDAMLRQHPWNFAKKFTSPAALDGTPPSLWTFMYLYPIDALRILGITNPLGRDLEVVKYEIGRNASDKRCVFTDEESPEIVYIAQITNTEEYDPEFTLALSFGLAARLAMPLTGDRGIATELQALADKYVHIAWETDSSEGIEPSKPEATWITDRL